MKTKSKLKPIDMVSALKQVEAMASKHLQVRAVDIQLRKYSDKQEYALEATIFYDEASNNFSATIYDWQGELTIKNLLLELDEELKKLKEKLATIK